MDATRVPRVEQLDLFAEMDKQEAAVQLIGRLHTIDQLLTTASKEARFGRAALSSIMEARHQVTAACAELDVIAQRRLAEIHGG